MSRMPRSVLGTMFDPARASGWRSLGFALLAYTGLSWLVDTGLAEIDARGRGMSWSLAPALLLLGVCGLYWEWRRARAPSCYHLKPPPRCRGLIVALSPFQVRGAGIKDLQDLEARLKLGLNAEDEAEIGRTNWGPLYVAARHHASELERCWILCSPAVEEQYVTARSLVEAAVARAAGRRVEVRRTSLDDPSDIAAAVDLMEVIFREARRDGLKDEDLIADMTGGTAAVSAGMALATLPEGRRLEYLRQEQGNRKFDLTRDGHLRPADQQAKDGVLVALDIGIADLPEAVRREVG